LTQRNSKDEIQTPVKHSSMPGEINEEKVSPNRSLATTILVPSTSTTTSTTEPTPNNFSEYVEKKRKQKEVEEIQIKNIEQQKIEKKRNIESKKNEDMLDNLLNDLTIEISDESNVQEELENFKTQQ